MKLTSTPQRIFDGYLISVADSERTTFYDWNDLSRPIHRLDLSAEKVWWDENNEQVAIAT